jgi:hypothetical protein
MTGSGLIGRRLRSARLAVELLFFALQQNPSRIVAIR